MSILSPTGRIATFLRKGLLLGDFANPQRAPQLGIDIANWFPATAFYLQRILTKNGAELSLPAEIGTYALQALGPTIQQVLDTPRGSAFIRGTTPAEEKAKAAALVDPNLERLKQNPAVMAAAAGARMGIWQTLAAWAQRVITFNYTFSFEETSRLFGSAFTFVFFPQLLVTAWRGPKNVRQYLNLTPEQIQDLRSWMAKKCEANSNVLGEPMTYSRYEALSSGGRAELRAKVYIEMLTEQGKLTEPEAQEVYRGITKKERTVWAAFIMGALSFAAWRVGTSDPVAATLNTDYRPHFGINPTLDAMKGAAAV